MGWDGLRREAGHPAEIQPVRLLLVLIGDRPSLRHRDAGVILIALPFGALFRARWNAVPFSKLRPWLSGIRSIKEVIAFSKKNLDKHCADLPVLLAVP